MGGEDYRLSSVAVVEVFAHAVAEPVAHERVEGASRLVEHQQLSAAGEHRAKAVRMRFPSDCLCMGRGFLVFSLSTSNFSHSSANFALSKLL